MSEDQQDVNLSESSTEDQATEQNQPAESGNAPSGQAASAAPAEENVPFHKHPRFQELIHSNNEYKSQLQEQAKLLQELQSQMKKSTPAERDELMERLEGIDPKFAAMLRNMREELKTSRQQLEEFSQWRQQSSAESTQQRISGIKDRFYADNKVPDDRKAIYEAMVDAEAGRNPNLKLSDLPNVMKQVHDQLSKMFTSVERNTTKQFVENKKAEAAKPSSLPKGAPAQAKKPDQSNLSKAEVLAEMKREVLSAARSSKDI